MQSASASARELTLNDETRGPDEIAVLYMNDMRADDPENLIAIARAAERATLLQLVAREQVDLYRDGPWRKRYRQGGPLEWCNADGWKIVAMPSRARWRALAGEQWDIEFGRIPVVHPPAG